MARKDDLQLEKAKKETAKAEERSAREQQKLEKAKADTADAESRKASADRAKIEAQRRSARSDMLLFALNKSIPFLGWSLIAWVVSLGAADVAKYLAGKQTGVFLGAELAITLTITFTVTLSAAGIWKILSQRKELTRLRRRVKELEGMITELQGGKESAKVEPQGGAA